MAKRSEATQALKLLSKVKGYTKVNCENQQVMSGCYYDEKKCVACDHFKSHRSLDKVMDIIGKQQEKGG